MIQCDDEANPTAKNPHDGRTKLIRQQYTLDNEGKRVYTLKKVLNGEVTKSAHPARFSPDDKYSRYVRPGGYKGIISQLRIRLMVVSV